jgi:uncharacterized DUF497 family protein
MGRISFVWDEDKNQKNIKAHKVSFEEAKTVFYDPNAKIVYDPDHSQTEDRFIILGLSKWLNVLIVCHCYREKEEEIRIFSARKATKNEKNTMEEIQMRAEYDFSKAKPNPYIKKLRKQITIRIDTDTIEYFKKQAEETGIKYQNLINMYLSDCVMNEKTIKIGWK